MSRDGNAGVNPLRCRASRVSTAEDHALTDAHTHAIQLRLRGRGNLDSLVLAIRDLRGVTSVKRITDATWLRA